MNLLLPVQTVFAVGYCPEFPDQSKIVKVIFVTLLWYENEYFHTMKTLNKKLTKDEKVVTWFSRLLRWTLGVLFILSGVIYADRRNWPAILFGTLILITGFFKPKRCINDCRIDHR